MTENEEIKKVINGLNFLKEKLYNGIYADRLDCIDYAISDLKEVQQYRKIGTVKECREAVEKQKVLCESSEKYADGKCVGYGKSEMDDEPIEMCKRCKSYVGFEESEEE